MKSERVWGVFAQLLQSNGKADNELIALKTRTKVPFGCHYLQNFASILGINSLSKHLRHRISIYPFKEAVAIWVVLNFPKMVK